MPAPTLIRIIAAADGRPCPIAGRYVVSCDFDAYNGRGHIVTAADPARAMHFADSSAAMVYWQTQTTVNPTRPDGRPNRPLTAFTVDIGPAP